MIRFLILGLIRDRSRSLFPVLTVALGVSIVVLMESYMRGALSEMIEVNARFEAGHLKIMTKAYHEEFYLKPNDLALAETTRLLQKISEQHKTISWHPRIKFSGILDIPDHDGNTKAQGTVAGLAVNLLGKSSEELKNLNLESSIVKGRLPNSSEEILVSDLFFNTLGLKLQDNATLISTAIDGGTAVANFKIVGTVHFGVDAMDRGYMIGDVKSIASALYMDDMASEVLGFFPGAFNEAEAEKIKKEFNRSFSDASAYAPIMITVRDQGGFGQYLDLGKSMGSIMIFIFIIIISIVLWNAGVRNGIRRYSEFGLRLAVGETPSHIFKTLLLEAFVIGVAGSVLGTMIGLLPSYYLQEVGFAIKGMIDSKNAAILFQDTVRAQISLTSFWIGFVPGIFSTLLGTAIAGRAIFKRNTATLFKELEV